MDESLLTGEYLPQARGTGDAVTAGTLNVESPLTVEVSALGDATRLSAIVRLLERAQTEKPRLAQIADRAAQAFLLFFTDRGSCDRSRLVADRRCACVLGCTGDAGCNLPVRTVAGDY